MTENKSFMASYAEKQDFISENKDYFNQLRNDARNAWASAKKTGMGVATALTVLGAAYFGATVAQRNQDDFYINSPQIQALTEARGAWDKSTSEYVKFLRVLEVAKGKGINQYDYEDLLETEPLSGLEDIAQQVQTRTVNARQSMVDAKNMYDASVELPDNQENERRFNHFLLGIIGGMTGMGLGIAGLLSKGGLVRDIKKDLHISKSRKQLAEDFKLEKETAEDMYRWEVENQIFYHTT